MIEPDESDVGWDDRYVEPRNPYVEIRVRDVDTGEDVVERLRPINGDTVTIWVRGGETYAGFDHEDGGLS